MQQAVPAVATAPKSKGFLASLFGSSDRIKVPLTDPLPGVVLPEHVAPAKDAPKTEMTTLSNGLKVASENTPVGSASLYQCTIASKLFARVAYPDLPFSLPLPFFCRVPPQPWAFM